MKGILLDVEGTTTPIHFVTHVLFPFARANLESHVERNFETDGFHADWEHLRSEYGGDERAGRKPPPWDDETRAASLRSGVTYALWLMDQDRKSTALKALQGRIWQAGYRAGTLKGEVFDDVPPALLRWSTHDIDVRIFSSGSVLAQKLLFSTVESGDLTRFLRGYFDTTTGAKTRAESYASIARAFDLPAGGILFVSDVTSELDAARSAGMETALCVRPGNPLQPEHGHGIVESLSSL